jgi:outer membrane protein OmpA-like peptidoglycan-associated protein
LVRAARRGNVDAVRPRAFFLSPQAAIVLVGLLAPALCGVAHADPPRSGVRLDGLQPASPDSSFFRAEGPHKKQIGITEVALGAGIDFAEAPLRAVIIDNAGKTDSYGKAINVVDRALVLRIAAALTPVYWLRFNLQAPFALFEQSSVAPGTSKLGQTIVPPSAPGIGDLRAGLHFRPLDTESIDLVFGGQFWAPVGSTAAYMSDGRLRGEVDLAVAGQVGKLLYGCTVSISPGFFIPRDGDRFATSCGIHGLATPNLSLGIEPSFALFRDLRSSLKSGSVQRVDAFTFHVEPLAAIRFKYEGFAAALSAGPGIGDAPGAAPFRAMLQLSYQIDGKPKPPPADPGKPTDLDVDGIPNERDACPEEAGLDNPDAKLRGCPIVDTDGDLVRDEEDACVNSAGTKSKEAKANGCPDSDNDLLPDPIDSCKNEPGAAPNGCPAHARLVKRAFQITPAIQFAEGSSTLSKQAKAALEEIAATMRANPKLGHVSIVLGTGRAPAALSDRRAEQIGTVLRNANVDPQRFEIVLQGTLRSGSVEVKLLK